MSQAPDAPIASPSTEPQPLDRFLIKEGILADAASPPSESPLSHCLLLKSLTPLANQMDRINSERVHVLQGLRELLAGLGTTVPQTPEYLSPRRLAREISTLIQMLENNGEPLTTLHHLVSNTLAPALSSDNPTQEINSICKTFKYGLQGFKAAGGRVAGVPRSVSSSNPTSPPSPAVGQTSERRATKLDQRETNQRNTALVTRCQKRDILCPVTNAINSCQVAHILPFSLGSRYQRSRNPPSINWSSDKGYQFWRFLDMFLGQEKTTSIFSDIESLDILQNVILLRMEAHDLFGKGRLTITPLLSSLDLNGDDPTITQACIPA